MNKYFLALIFLFFKFVFLQIFSFPYPIFDPLICLALVYAFFHSLEIKSWAFYTLFCAVLRDVFSLDVFGIYIFSFLFSCMVVSVLARLLYRDNWLLVFPAVFTGVFLHMHAILFLKTVLFSESIWISNYGLFFCRAMSESIFTAVVVYPVYLIGKKCVPELIA